VRELRDDFGLQLNEQLTKKKKEGLWALLFLWAQAYNLGPTSLVLSVPLTFQTEILPAHVRAATAGIFWRQAAQPLSLGLLGVLWLGAHLSLAVLFPGTPFFMHALLGLLLWGSVLGMAWVAKRHYEALAAENFKRFEGAPVDVRLEADAYHYSASWGQGQLAWDRFQSLWCLKDVWVLLQHAKDGASVLLPAVSLDDDARDFIVARLHENKAELRR
jgi:hypothetical protein